MIALGTARDFFKDMEMEIRNMPNRLLVLTFRNESKHFVRVVVSADLTMKFRANEVTIDELLDMEVINRNGIFYIEEEL